MEGYKHKATNVLKKKYIEQMLWSYLKVALFFVVFCSMC